MGLFPIKIPLTPSLITATEKWANKFNSCGLARWSKATVINSALTIDAMGLADFIKLADAADCSEFDVRKLKTEAIKQVELSLKRRKTNFSITGLQDILSDLRNVTVGEWKDEDFVDPPRVHKRLKIEDSPKDDFLEFCKTHKPSPYLYPQVPAEEWAKLYGLSLEPSPCGRCGKLRYPTVPFANGTWRGLESEPHEPCLSTRGHFPLIVCKETDPVALEALQRTIEAIAKRLQ